MIINQYAGNTDWDHHNWYAIRRHNTESTLSEGFRFLCWDSEIILENERENVLSKNNGAQSPTGIFQQLLRNDDFARRYLRRAKQLLKDDGLLGQESVVAVWDSLYHTISTALYDEAARWGDYRRDVHRWQTAGQLYTVDNHYMAERNRLLTQYFPVRTNNVLNQITSYVNIDDFEMPADASADSATETVFEEPTVEEPAAEEPAKAAEWSPDPLLQEEPAAEEPAPEEPKDEFVEDPSLGPIVDMTMSRDDDEEELPEIHGANEKDDDLFASREGSQGNFFG